MENSEKADPEPVPKSDDSSPSQGKSCALCGCATPAVRCDRCNSQIFCLSCDDMYHRHPKRKLHLRKAVDSIWSSTRSPRLRRRSDLPGDPCKIPIPPPRTKKRERHSIGGRMFLKSGLELGSFGHSKVFESKNRTPSPKDFYTGQKSPASLVGSNCDEDTSNQLQKNEDVQIYENDNVANQNLDGNDRSPWNTTRPNMASPIQVSIPSNSPDMVNGQSFGYPMKPLSQSAADLTGHSGHLPGHHPYHFHPPYPYMHPPMHPYSHSMAHLNCPQCISSSWSNVMSPHPSPYFHPMPWGSAQNTMSRHPVPAHGKHSHGDLTSYPESNFPYPYPGAGYFHPAGGPPVVDPNFIKDLHEQAEMQKSKREVMASKNNPGVEEMDVTMDSAPAESESVDTSQPISSANEGAASANQDVQEEEMLAIPEAPTEPWSCVHCTYVNPPGSHICEICCKTSFGAKKSQPAEDQSAALPRSRDSESPLINRDALLNTPDMSGFREAQKDADIQKESPPPESGWKEQNISTQLAEVAAKLTTETQTSTSTKTTDVQTQNLFFKSIASSTDSLFPRHEISVQTEVEATAQNCSVATDPMISSQSLESLLSGVSAPPYHNRRAGWGRGTSFSTQSLYERGRSRSPMPRSVSMYNEAQQLGRDPNFPSEEVMHSVSQAWLYADPMYYKPHNQGFGQTLSKEDYFDGTWGSMDRLNRRVKHKKDKGKVESIQPKFHRSLDDLKSEKRPEMTHVPELLMLQTVKEAERCGFSLEDLHVAYLHCGKENPVFWLEDNWNPMIKNVIALAAKYGEDNEENDVGVITVSEAKDALHIHRGDIWDAVTECIENRQRKILELTVRGNFTQKQIAETLKNNEGNVELAFADLVKATTRRHKFILSPGLSEDSEDLNIYNPTEDSSVDRHLSPLRAAKIDISAESKTEKKKSDFLTKLSAIREAQSERRKAREEKELIRETITQDFPASDGEVSMKDKDTSLDIMTSMSREDSKEVDENVQDIAVDQSPVVEVVVESKPEPVVEIPDINENVTSVKESTEESMPMDFDTNWSESQGEWIEEYSDEQWDENDDTHWVGLGKKFQKMQKEFEEEAMQMAALWEKEELEDDVFEDETKEMKLKIEDVTDSDKKFDDWVKANLKADSFELEEGETKRNILRENVSDVVLRDSLELETSRPSPLQHYPTSLDLSLKSEFESDWVDLPPDEEIEKLAHDIVCEGSDIENKFDEEEIISHEEKEIPRKISDQEVSDEDWEKIEMDEQQLQDDNELDKFAFPDKELDKNISELDQSLMENIINEEENELATDKDVVITIDKDAKVLYKNIEELDQSIVEDTVEKESELVFDSAVDSDADKISKALYKNLERISSVDAEFAPAATESFAEISQELAVDDTAISFPREKLPSSDSEQPRPPVRRKSRLSSASIEQALKNSSMGETSSDIPPVLPEKTKKKILQPDISDLYAMPDKNLNILDSDLVPAVPEKPPRLNLPAETAEPEVEKEPEIPPRMNLSKDVSLDDAASLSNESESNCFADSESDIEEKLHRQKNIHRKLVKHKTEFESAEWDDDTELKLDEKNDALLESNLDIDLDDDLDPALIEPLPVMKSLDFNPELPIPFGGRGARISELEDVTAPKAFREDTARPLQLFKATKRETPTNTLNKTSSLDSGLKTLQRESAFTQSFDETFLRTKDEFPMLSPEFQQVPDPIGISPENLMQNAHFQTSVESPISALYENQGTDKYYYNEAVPPKPNLSERLPTSQENEPHFMESLISSSEINREAEQIIEVEATAEKEDEAAFSEMERLSAVADYFFGCYNEITVTPPKKKVPGKPKPTATPSKPDSPSPKPMSTSEITSKLEASTEMNKSAVAVLETKAEPKSASAIPSQQQVQKEKQVISEPITIKETSTIQKTDPVTSEYESFFDDYFFGCYNEVVVVPKKPKNKPITLQPIPKLGESWIQRLQKEKEVKPVQPAQPPEVPAAEPEEPEEVEEPEEIEEMLEDEESMLPSETSSLVYDELFHDLPAEILSNQSFDDGGSIYYESFQDAVEELQEVPASASAVNIKSKTVHFEESVPPVAPPRRNKAQVGQKFNVTNSATSNEDYASEYMFRQYEMGSQAKKKTSIL